MAAGKTAEDDAFGIVAGALIDGTPDRTHFAGAVKTRNRLVFHVENMPLRVTLRSAESVEKRRPVEGHGVERLQGDSWNVNITLSILFHPPC